MKILSKSIVFLIAFFSMSITFGQDTYLDDFDTASYSNNHGTKFFSGNWIETSDDNKHNDGRIRINNKELRFIELKNNGSIHRYLNLAGETSVILTLDYRVTNWKKETLLVQLRNGSSWESIITLSGNGSGSVSHTLTAGQISADSGIRFITGSGKWDDDDKDIFYIDNVLFTVGSNEPPTITASGDQLYCPGTEIPIVESVSITDPDNRPIDKVYVQISSNYNNGKDRLKLTGSPSGVTSSWNASEGKLTLTGPATSAQFEAALLGVVFSTTAMVSSGDTRNFSIVLSEANYLISTGHYYEYVPALGITWTAARTAAAARTFYGLQGYLATLTTAEEAEFVGKQSQGAGWIGASDSAVEGQWRWVTGPEAGTLFWQGAANGATTAPDNYANWNNVEPNNSGTGGEHYAHIYLPGNQYDGTWNDLSNTGATSGDYQPKGYLVEYGGMPSDPQSPQISAVTKILVDNIKPTASNPAPVTVYCTSGIPAPNINVVTDEADNCTTNPIVTFINDSSNGGSNPEIITRTYRVTDAAGNSTDVTQTITVRPVLVTTQPADQIGLAGDTASFMVSANNADTYQWQVSTNSGGSFVNIADGTDYSGTQTNTLFIPNLNIAKNGYRYRVLVSNSSSGCLAITSNAAVLTVQVGSVITNKKITYRVEGGD